MVRSKKEPRDKGKERLMEIALGIHWGQIFTDRHLGKGVKAEDVFLPLVLMDEKQLKEFKESKPGAPPRAINGNPCFMSVQCLSQGDTEKVLKMVRILKEGEERIEKELGREA